MTDETSAVILQACCPKCSTPYDFNLRIQEVLGCVKLTKKEKLVAKLLLEGLDVREIAEKEANTVKTMKHHVSSVYRAFRVDNRYQLFRLVFS